MMKQFSVYLRVTKEQKPVWHTYVTAPTAIAAIQSAMLIHNVQFVHYGLSLLDGAEGKGESATLIDFVYVPIRSARKVVR
ncbi:MAG: hypothetical protein NVS9B9_31890 [Ktedonobacteraceae bacterium]